MRPLSRAQRHSSERAPQCLQFRFIHADGELRRVGDAIAAAHLAAQNILPVDFFMSYHTLTLIE